VAGCGRSRKRHLRITGTKELANEAGLLPPSGELQQDDVISVL